MKKKEWKTIEHPDEGLDDITLPEYTDTNLVNMHLTDIEYAQRKLSSLVFISLNEDIQQDKTV